MIMSMLASKQVPIDQTNVPLASLVPHEEQVDVNFVKNNFNNNAYRNNFGNNNNYYKPYPSNNGNPYGNYYGNFSGNTKTLTDERIFEVEKATKFLCKLNMSKIRAL